MDYTGRRGVVQESAQLTRSLGLKNDSTSKGLRLVERREQKKKPPPEVFKKRLIVEGD